MKRILPYIIVFFGATTSAALVMAALYLMKPDLLIPSASSTAVVVDSMMAKGEPVIAPGDSAAVDTVQAVAAMEPDTAALRDSGGAPPPPPLVGSAVKDTVAEATTVTVAPADSGWGKEQKAMAKVFESMEPASAARIMRDIPDDDVRRIILTLKKRQAAKILSAIDPDRAARIMR